MTKCEGFEMSKIYMTTQSPREKDLHLKLKIGTNFHRSGEQKQSWKIIGILIELDLFPYLVSLNSSSTFSIKNIFNKD